MSISLDHLTHILAKAKISSSQEEEILIAAKDVITPPEATKEETIFEEACTFDDEQLCEQEIKELRHDLRSENYAYERIIKRWFQAGTRLDPFSFSFILLNYSLNN